MVLSGGSLEPVKSHRKGPEARTALFVCRLTLVVVALPLPLGPDLVDALKLASRGSVFGRIWRAEKFVVDGEARGFVSDRSIYLAPDCVFDSREVSAQQGGAVHLRTENISPVQIGLAQSSF